MRLTVLILLAGFACYTTHESHQFNLQIEREALRDKVQFQSVHEAALKLQVDGYKRMSEDMAGIVERLVSRVLRDEEEIDKMHEEIAKLKGIPVGFKQ